MEDNKKSKKRKGLFGRHKEVEVKEEQAEVVAEDKEEAAAEAAEPEVDLEEEARRQQEIMEKVDSQNKLDTMYKLYCKWCEYQQKGPMRKVFAEWVRGPVDTDADSFEMPNVPQKAEIFRRQMLLAADKILKQIEAAEAAAEKLRKAREEGTDEEREAAAAQPDIKLPPDINVEVHVQIPMGGTEAFLLIFPPFGAGAILDEEGLNMKLAEAGIASGLRLDLVKQIVENQFFFRIFLIAVGRPAIPGEDGKLIDHIPREEVLSFKEGEDGRVNYRDLNLFRNIEKGDVICDIIPPSDGRDGRDVRGGLIKAAKGKKADVPMGENTQISEDGNQLVAASDGYISFEHGKFRVAQQLVIRGNVDMSVGNQDFLGDIIVHGDVISGFTLKATGNIFVKGVVEGAVLTAGGDIEIGDGMNGNNFGELNAGGNVSSAFLENVKINAGGDIHAESMIACQVECQGDVYVDKGMGVIISGEINAAGSVYARIIGSKAQRKTEINIGKKAEIREEKEKKKAELEKIEETRSLLQKNLQLLQPAAEAGVLSPEQKAVFKQISEQEALYGSMMKELQHDLEELDALTGDFSKCMVHCGMVFPPTKVTIGNSMHSVDTVTAKCKFYYSKDGEVIMGVE